GLRGARSVAALRALAALDAVGWRGVEGRVGLEGEALILRLEGRVVGGARAGEEEEPAPGPPTWPAVGSSRFAGAPAPGVLAAAGLALGEGDGPLGVGALLDLVARVDRADPSRAGVAPLRTRLNVLAAPARVNPEADLWPVLRGVSACLLVDGD